MFPKREPQQGEVCCPYDGVAYSKVPGYISGYGCPVCGAIGQYHLPIEKSAQHSAHVDAKPASAQEEVDRLGEQLAANHAKLQKALRQ